MILVGCGVDKKIVLKNEEKKKKIIAAWEKNKKGET